jgi:hypothetical protein
VESLHGGGVKRVCRVYVWEGEEGRSLGMGRTNGQKGLGREGSW